MNILNIWRLAFVFLASSLSIPSYSGQDGAHVYIQASAEDSVGKLLVYSLREQIRKSSGMELVDLESSAAFYIHIVTMDPDDNGYSTIYSLVLTAKQWDRDAQVFWTNFVGNCGLQRVEICATKIAAETDQMIAQIKTAILEALKEAAEEAKRNPQPKKKEEVNF